MCAAEYTVDQLAQYCSDSEFDLRDINNQSQKEDR